MTFIDQIKARFQSGNSVQVDKAVLPKAEFDYLIHHIEQLERAMTVWLDKTEWVQKTGEWQELGMHHADVLKQRIERLEKRLEIDPRTNYDGIDCRDATIRELERENAELQAKLEAADKSCPQSMTDLVNNIVADRRW